MSDFMNIDLYWIREDERQDAADQQQEWESEQIACWLDVASSREINQVWSDLDYDLGATTDKMVEMVLDGLDAKSWLKQHIQDIAEKQFADWKRCSAAAYKDRS